MSNIEIVFTNPWYLLLAIPSLLIILLPFLRLPPQRRNSFRKITPVVLHTVVVTLLVLVLSGFTVVKHSYDKAVMLVMDLSESTKTVQEDIETHAAQLLALVEEKTPVGVVVFGQNQIYTVEFQEERILTTAKVEGAATDIGEALDYAASLLPYGKAGHLILLSDGKQTNGDVNETALQLAAQGIRIDAVYFDTTQLDTPEVQLTSLQAPEGAYVGDTMTFTADIESNTEGQVTLSLYNGSKLAQRQQYTVTTGSNLVELTCEAASAGVHAYQLVIDPKEDTLEQNNECYAYVKVTGEASVLVIGDNLSNAKTLAAVLDEDYSVATASVWDAPQTIIELCNYDQVVLSNADISLLPRGYEQLLSDYVSVYGRSVLAVGGEKTFMYGGMVGTKYEEMLPVELKLEEDDNAEPVALMLVLDCSTSMIRNPMYLAVAKQGAIRCVEAMSGNDYVGVITFNQVAQVQSPLVRATPSNKESLTRLISGLSTGTDTYYSDALRLAHEGLKNSNAKTKHIIFLSDGEPNRRDRSYMFMVEQAAADGITVSTIGLGLRSTSLQNMSLTGNGRYYFVNDAAQLPNIMLSETNQIAVESLITGKFVPRVARKSAMTEVLGSTKLPALQGYLGTTLKDDATVFLSTEKGHPIYAQWNYGKGMVGCFTNDLNGTWSADWLKDPTACALIRSMVNSTIDQKRYTSSLSAQITPVGENTQVTVTTADTTESKLTVSVELGGNSNSYDLAATEPGIYTATIPTAKAGVYEVLVTQTDMGGAVLDYLSTNLAVSYPGEYNVYDTRGQELLTIACGNAGGQLHTDMKALANIPVGSVRDYLNPMIVMAIIASILMVADIAIRKLRWKDVRNFFLSPNAK